MRNTVTGTVDGAFEEFPFDFNAYLGERLGIERDGARAALGRWLVQYEPAPSRRGRVTTKGHPSGVFPCPEGREAHANALSDVA
jgi:hypothetical protein